MFKKNKRKAVSRKQKNKIASVKIGPADIQPEEIFLDASQDQKQKIESPIGARRVMAFSLIVLACFIFFIGKSGWLQIARGDDYRSQADKNCIKAIPIFAPRGIIYDRNGEQLVSNIPIFDVAIMPMHLPPNEEQKTKVLQRTAEILNKTVEEIAHLIEENDFSASGPILLVAAVTDEQVLALKAESFNLPGIILVENSQRQYFSSLYFSHIIGYVGRMDSSDLEKYSDYFPNEIIGKSGLEIQYEEVLRAAPGREEIEVNARGQVKGETNYINPSSASGLVLAINGELQKKLYDELNIALEKNRATKAAAAAIDPRNGDILALVSLPSFDNNLLVGRINQQECADLFQDPDQPLFNRVVSGQYPPGSTIKPFIGAVALEEGIVTPKQKINDKGSLVIVNQYNPGVVYTFPDWKTHGLMDIYSAIAQSCNIYFYHVGGGYGDIEGLGINRLEKYLKLFSFSKLTGIDLSNEKRGFVPSVQWKKEVKGEDWYIGDTYHLSIGQGGFTVTPLQMAVLTAAIANGGTIWQPRVVDKIIDSEKNVIIRATPDTSDAVAAAIKEIQPQGKQIDFISDRNIEIIREAMRQTIVSGSAQYLSALPVEVAGKTGTAQTFQSKRNNAWFTAFAPYDNPEITLAIMIEEGGEGSTAAVPVAKEVLEWYFSR